MWFQRSLFSAFLTAVLTAAVVAHADVSTNEPGAIIVFPKIVSDADQDTIIQLTNATGSTVSALCFYTNGSIDPLHGTPTWLIKDFQITLTRLQPTVWVAGEGVAAAPSDRPPSLFPGKIPPVELGFTGELRCIAVNDNEIPVARNAFIGEATIVNHTTGATRKYQAVALQAAGDNDGDTTLRLDDREYTSCPRVILFDHFFDDAPDPILKSPVNSTLTLVPCSEDLEHLVPGTATLQFEVFNEFEQRLSASLTVTCFQELPLSSLDGNGPPARSIFNFALEGTLVGQTRIRPVVDTDTAHGHGVIAVAEEFRNGGQSGSAINLHFISGNLQSDLIVLPSSF